MVCNAALSHNSFLHTELAANGIGVHHAGMSMDDRRATESLYLNKILRVVVCTSVSSAGYSICDYLNPPLDTSSRRQPA